MNNFILVPLLFVILTIGCFGLECHFCQGTDTDKMSECADNMPTEVRECTLSQKPKEIKDKAGKIIKIEYIGPRCGIETMPYRGEYTMGDERTKLGCEYADAIGRELKQPQYCSGLHYVGVDATAPKSKFKCTCNSDRCNTLEGGFSCLECQDGIRHDNYCGDKAKSDKDESDKKAERKPCPLDMKYCKTIHNDNPNLLRPQGYFKGCTRGIPRYFNVTQTSTQHGYCLPVYRKDNSMEYLECYCNSTNYCNNFLEIPPIVKKNGGVMNKFDLLVVLMAPILYIPLLI